MEQTKKKYTPLISHNGLIWNPFIYGKDKTVSFDTKNGAEVFIAYVRNPLRKGRLPFYAIHEEDK